MWRRDDRRHALRFARRVAWILLLLVGIGGQWRRAEARPRTSLADVLVEDPRLDIMSSAMANMVSIEIPFDSPPYTVIAPTNDAFQNAILEGSILCDGELRCSSIPQLLTSPELPTIVYRHVFQGELQPAALQNGQQLRTVDGMYVKVERQEPWDLRIGGAKLVTSNPEIHVADGIVLVVDSVLIDPAHINTSTIEAAERIADVGPFSFSQREILVEEIGENIRCFRKLRTLGLQDGQIQQSPAITFNPAFTKPSITKQDTQELDTFDDLKVPFALGQPSDELVAIQEEDELHWRIPSNVNRPDDDKDLAYMTVRELASLLRQGKVTSVELTKLYLSRLKRYDEFLEVVVTYTEALALSQAATADKEIKMGLFRSPLHGIPYGLKDLISVPGYPTTWGAAPYANQTFNKGAWAYKKLRDAGAVLVAKLATGAMAWGDIWFGGRTKNPWNIAEGSCGSSSGSGAATSAGLIPFAIGTETWGSMSCPSETMGITGYRPTFGTVGRTGVMTLASSLDKVGTFCREATDCAIIMDVMKGKDHLDPSSVDTPHDDPGDIDVGSLKIGFVKEADLNVVNTLESLGATLVPITLEHSVPADAIMNIILGSEAGAFFDDWMRSDKSSVMREQRKWPSYLRGARLIPAVEYVQANRARLMLMKEVDELLEGLDAVLAPARRAGSHNAMGNVIGLPQIVFPVGFNSLVGARRSKRKDPKAQALFGLPFSDAKILAIASAYQGVTNHHLMQPPIDDVEQEVKDLCLPFSRCTLQNGEPSSTATPLYFWERVGNGD